MGFIQACEALLQSSFSLCLGGSAHQTSERPETRLIKRGFTMFAARTMSNAAAPARAAVSRAVVAAPRRGMAGGPPPKYTGFEAKVREKLPKDEHVSC